jgi:hypothetical protein
MHVPAETRTSEEIDYTKHFGWPSAVEYPNLPVPKPNKFDDDLPQVSDP